jgi:hypothetical protein
MLLLRAGLCLLSASLAMAAPQVTQVAAVNVNTRYTIEEVQVTGDGDVKLSRGLRQALSSLTGSRLDFALLEDLAERIRAELHAKAVTHRILRGTIPDHVKVVFEITRRSVELDLSVPRFLYHSKQGWTGQGEAAMRIARHRAAFGVMSDNDELVERSTGIYARYERRQLGGDRLAARFLYEGYRARWNPATLETLTDGMRLESLVRPGESVARYRTRQNIEPEIAVALTRHLTWAAGLSFQRLEPQERAGAVEAANSVKMTLRYDRLWEGSGGEQVFVDGMYGLRTAADLLGSDYRYTRHRLDGQAGIVAGRHRTAIRVQAGAIGGRAPFFERFVAGNSHTLRGWNRFDLAPAGGTRLLTQSLEYRYRWVFVFYDAGAVWNRSQPATVRHSLGGGLRKDNLFLALAFPVREGRTEPVLMAGMNF